MLDASRTRAYAGCVLGDIPSTHPVALNGALVVDGQVYVQAANGPTSSWYQAAIAQKAGRVRVEGRTYDVTFAEAPADLGEAIDAAYEDKYPGSSAVPVMQGDGPKSAIVVISRR